MYSIECEICGVFFEAQRSTRKYCDKCQKHSDRKKRTMDSYVSRSKCYLGYYDEPVEKKCSKCGEFLKVVPRRISNRIMYCENCKKILAEEKEQTPKAPRIRYCNYNNRPPQSTCPVCGKKYDNPNFKKAYCSDECRTKHHGEIKKWIGDITCTCKNCGKEFTIHKDKYIYKLPVACSDECRKEINKAATTARAIEKRKNNKAQLKYERIKQQKLFKENGLCAYCKTPYKDCERMQTNFRVIPKGAKFNMDGKIIKCPKFKN